MMNVVASFMIGYFFVAFCVHLINQETFSVDHLVALAFAIFVVYNS